jgi:hypothetical protein
MAPGIPCFSPRRRPYEPEANIPVRLQRLITQPNDSHLSILFILGSDGKCLTLNDILFKLRDLKLSFFVTLFQFGISIGRSFYGLGHLEQNTLVKESRRH